MTDQEFEECLKNIKPRCISYIVPVILQHQDLKLNLKDDITITERLMAFVPYFMMIILIGCFRLLT